jgi:hypothetical protein
MSRRRLTQLFAAAGALAAVAGTLTGRWHWSAPTQQSIPERRVAPESLFRFSVDHPPVIWHNGASPVSFEVPIVNRSPSAVRFSHFACDCGCTSARLDREELQPGETATVRMAVDLSGRQGPQRFACHWNDESGQRWSAETRVTVYKPAQFDPDAIRLGRVTPGDTISRQVHFDEYATTEAELPPAPGFSIDSIYRDPVQLVASPAVVESLGPGLVRRRTSIDVKVTVANRAGYAEAILTRSTPPADRHPTPSLRIDWFVRETVEVSPARLALTFPPKGEGQQTQVVRVRPTDGRPIVINRVTTSDPGIGARVLDTPRSPAGDAEIEVSVALAEGKGLLAGDVILHLGVPERHEVRIPVTALRVERPVAAEGS